MSKQGITNLEMQVLLGANKNILVVCDTKITKKQKDFPLET